MAVDTGDLVDFSAREVPFVEVTAATREKYLSAIRKKEGGGGDRGRA